MIGSIKQAGRVLGLERQTEVAHIFSPHHFQELLYDTLVDLLEERTPVYGIAVAR